MSMVSVEVDLLPEMFASARLKRHVIVHVTFIKLGEINTLKEVFEADVLVLSKWREPLLDGATVPKDVDLTQFWNPKIYIDNVVDEPKVTSSLHLEYSINGEAFVVERKRFKGNYMEHMELFEFPFDTQDLSLAVMSDMPSTEVQLEEDPDQMHKIYKRSFIDEQEFYLYKYVSSEQTELQKDKADPFLKRSVLIVCCYASRRPGCFVWNHFSVTFLIACLAFLTFSVPSNLIQNRLQLAFTLILTNVAFKFVVSQNLPKISYLTYLDRYVLATMVCLTLVCLYHGIQTLLPEEKYPLKDYYALIILGGLYITYNIQFIVRLVLVPLKKERDLKHAESEYSKKVQEQAIRKHSTKMEKLLGI